MPNQQNPYKAGVESVLNNTGFSNSETFVVGVGGQTVFNVNKTIGGNVTVFENGTITVKVVNITEAKEITTGLMTEGTIVDIIY